MTLLRETIIDVLSGWPIGRGYYQTAMGYDEAVEAADEIISELGLTGHEVGCYPDPKHPGYWYCTKEGHV